MFGIIQLVFAVIIGLYFWNLLRNQRGSKVAIDRESSKEMEELRRLRSLSLTEPLSEKVRPSSFNEIIGQEEGLKALRAALCGPNPQHVLIYGPPGIGKTAAARLVLEEAKKNELSPFTKEAKFVEVDATTLRFDERGIADPLMGTVHDPIYQGAGPLGMAGIPQPKPGAVTKAHGGILFIDEIGELHPIQINKLLKVLEDRKVFLESSYYNSEEKSIPRHIHEIFQNGLPADFRLIGATTRQPEEIPPAVRSRCMEIFFRVLSPEEIGKIALNAAQRVGFTLTPEALKEITSFAINGRDAVNMVQLAVGIAQGEGRNVLDVEDMEWVVNNSRLSPRPEKKIPDFPQVGLVNGLAVYGPNLGAILEIEASVIPVEKGEGRLTITGIVEEEEVGGMGRTLRRKGTARGSVENVLTVLGRLLGESMRNYDIHLNFPGGVPVDGPSAGVGIATAIYSALKDVPVDNTAAMTGELSIRGLVCPVGGVTAKIDAAREAGAKKIFIPTKNWQHIYKEKKDIEIICVTHISEVFEKVLLQAGSWEQSSPREKESELYAASFLA
ncbi:MAG TPA: ATP-dependent protease LonB [Firmicutes bacterium]|jgi:Lon-like ATP-dependent protease|nr:ATP-dependent protease LonB [Bacillota bacterium]